MNGRQNLAAVLGEMKEKGKAYAYVSGTSMLPMLKEGRDIAVLTALKEEPRIGDVVMFVRERNDNELVLHRIVKVASNGRFMIRGDNTFWDEPVDRKDIKATVSGFFRKGKYTDCKTGRGYKIYVFLQLRFYFLRKFFCRTLRIAGAKVKNNILHLNSLHLSDIFKNK